MKSIGDRIFALLESGDVVRSRDIVAAVAESAETTEAAVRARLSSLAKEGKLHQPKYGYYQLPQKADASEPRTRPTKALALLDQHKATLETVEQMSSFADVLQEVIHLERVIDSYESAWAQIQEALDNK